MCEESGECRFPDATFAREDEKFMTDGGETRGYSWEIGVRAFGRRGADLLVGAARAGCGGAGLGGFGAGTVFRFGSRKVGRGLRGK